MHVQSPLAGFAFTDCNSLIKPDSLHQGDKGDTEHILDTLEHKLDEDSKALINERLMQISPFHGLPLPSRGLATEKMYASQQAAIFKCLPVALLGMEGVLPAALRVVIPGELTLFMSTCRLACA